MRTCRACPRAPSGTDQGVGASGGGNLLVMENRQGKSPSLSPLRNWRSDLPAAMVVFLVALPLCLGIALASGAPPIGGLLAGIVGGVVVGIVSKSALGVSGPAAGLAVIVFQAIQDLGSYDVFLAAVVIAGVLQIVLGLLRAGVLAYYFPSAVIKGMLAAIGIIIVMKQLPYALGFEAGSFTPKQLGPASAGEGSGEELLAPLWHMLNQVNWGAASIALICLGLIILWEQPLITRTKFKSVPGPLLAVVVGIGLGFLFSGGGVFSLDRSMFVEIPNVTLSNVSVLLVHPEWSSFQRPDVWKTGAVIAIVASLETLLCVDATDKLDPERRVTPTNREVFAQGTGNLVSGLIGGLPITQVIVRSSANIQNGGKTKASAITHGFLLLLCVLLIPGVLAMVPLATLAAVLIVVGTKLAKPALFKQMWKGGRYQFIPFAVTVAGVIVTDLLSGVMIGMLVGVFFILYKNYRTSFHFDPDAYRPGEPVRMILSEDVSFLNKASLQRTLGSLPPGARVVIDGSQVVDLDPDIDEILKDAVVRAPRQGVEIELTGFDPEPKSGPRPATPSSFSEHIAEVRAMIDDRKKKRSGRRTQASGDTKGSAEH
jgi:MFS superfamily sulfate permease-like transporter